MSFTGKTTFALVGAIAWAGLAAAPAAAQNGPIGPEDPGFYAALNAGAQAGGDFRFTDGDEFEGYSNGATASFSAVFGYVWPIPAAGGAIETEAEFNYTPSKINFDGPTGFSYNSYRGLGNLWFVFDTNGRVDPYLGGGVGYGTWKGLVPGGDSESGLAWQLGGGVRTNLSSDGRVYGGVGYRFVNQRASDVDGPGVDAIMHSHKAMVEVGVRLGR